VGKICDYKKMTMVHCELACAEVAEGQARGCDSAYTRCSQSAQSEWAMQSLNGYAFRRVGLGGNEGTKLWLAPRVAQRLPS
jgi:hypothetical protein